MLETVIAKAGYIGKVVIGMNVATLEFYDKDKTYELHFKEENHDGSQKILGDNLKKVYKSFVTDYPIVLIKDPFDQDDGEHYAKLTAEMGQQGQIVGDDLLITNPKCVKNATVIVELIYKIALICSLNPKVEYKSLDDDRVDNILKNAVEKATNALQLKDEYIIHV